MTVAGEKKFTMSKSLGALIIGLLGAAFIAGSKARFLAPEAEAREPHVTAASLAAPLGAVEAVVTAKQVEQLITDMRELRTKLDESTKQVGELNVRLARLEGACAAACGGR